MDTKNKKNTAIISSIGARKIVRHDVNMHELFWNWQNFYAHVG